MRNAFLFAALIGLMLFAACGHRTGNNPVGVTGGGENGYGNALTGLGWGPSGGGGDFDNRLLGGWRRNTGANDFDMIVFYSDGEVDWFHYANGSVVDSESGTFNAYGNNISIIIDGSVSTGTFSITGSTLTVTLNGVTTVWQRV